MIHAAADLLACHPANGKNEEATDYRAEPSHKLNNLTQHAASLVTSEKPVIAHRSRSRY